MITADRMLPAWAMIDRDLDHALEIANGTPYALTGGLYSRSPDNIATVKRRFRVGNLYINRKITGALVDRQPFGGFKLSGIGAKAGGPDYLVQFLVPRTVTMRVPLGYYNGIIYDGAVTRVEAPIYLPPSSTTTGRIEVQQKPAAPAPTTATGRLLAFDSSIDPRA